MGAGDMAFAYLENTKETAIDIKEALAQPFVLLARWIKDGNKYYYRAPIKSDGSSYAYNNATYVGLDKVSGTGGPTTLILIEILMIHTIHRATFLCSG